jgi:hypothetical protein
MKYDSSFRLFDRLNSPANKRIGAMGTVFLILIVGLVFCSGTAFGLDLYVAPTGDDNATGSINAPFATLEGARNAIRQHRASALTMEAITVHVRGGVYALPAPFRLEAQDSGTAEAPVTYRSFAGEHVTLVGGRPVTQWETHDGAILKADVAAQGFTGVNFRILVYKGERMEMARWPNVDPDDINGGAWAYVTGERFSMYADWPGEEEYHRANSHLDFWQRNVPKYTRMLTVKPEDARNWSCVQGAEVSIFPRFNWWHYLLPVASFEQEQDILHLEKPSFYEIRPGDRYFIRGILEELDAPGEWHLDAANGVLYFWPPSPITGDEVYAPVLDNAIVLDGCEHITLRGFTLECFEKTAVSLKDCRNCAITASTIRNSGGYDGHAVQIVEGAGNRICGNDIYDIGAYGVLLEGGKGLSSLALTGNVVDNNYIHHVGVVGRHAKAVELRGFGNTATHNLIHDIPQSGLWMWGANHTVEYNHIRHTCLEGEDTGAIGGGAIDWLGWQAVKIRYNLITDTFGFGFDEHSKQWKSPHFAWAIYPDWAASDVEIVGNILVRAPRGLLHFHSGRDNLVENNILVEGGENQIKCHGWTTETGFWSTRVEEWIKNYDEAMQEEAWKNLGTLDDPRHVPLDSGLVMHGNVFRKNICAYTGSDAALFDFTQLPMERVVSDYNLIWSQGAPLKTGRFVLKETIGPNLLQNPGAEEGPEGGFPAGWGNMHKAADDVTAAVVVNVSYEGKRSLRIFPGTKGENEKAPNIIYMSVGKTPFEPGETYQFAVWLKAEQPGLCVTIGAYSWKADAHSWTTDKNVIVGEEWQRYDILFRTPAPGDATYSSTMDELSVRITIPVGSGAFWVDNIELKKAATHDEWTAWQMCGLDEHSVVADPLFVNAAEDDYRLQPESPAWALGFEPIPVDRIGPYASEERASWPIIEAPGAREALRQHSGLPKNRRGLAADGLAL